MNYNPKHNSGRPFLCIDISSAPAPNVKTESRNWAHIPSNWHTGEQSYIVDRVNDKIMKRATVIIDLLEDKVVKSRYRPDENDAIMHHYRTKYADKVNQALNLVSLKDKLTEV